jgi:hypothetical protein
MWKICKKKPRKTLFPRKQVSLKLFLVLTKIWICFKGEDLYQKLIFIQVLDFQHFVHVLEVVAGVKLLPELAVQTLKLQIFGNDCQRAPKEFPLLVTENLRLPLAGAAGGNRPKESFEPCANFLCVAFLGQLLEFGHEPEAILSGGTKVLGGQNLPKEKNNLKPNLKPAYLF